MELEICQKKNLQDAKDLLVRQIPTKLNLVLTDLYDIFPNDDIVPKSYLDLLQS